MSVVYSTFRFPINLLQNNGRTIMQLGMCCVISLLVVTVCAQYRNDPYRFSNFRNRWADPYGISTAYVSHEIPMIEELTKGWMGSYRYRPFFSRVVFGVPPEIPPLPNGVHVQRPAISEESHEDHREGSIGFLDWKDEPFGPPKPMEFEEKFPAEDFDNQELEEEIAPGNGNDTGVTLEGNDFTQIKDDFNTTVVKLDDEDDDADSEEKGTEDEKDNSDKDFLLDDDDEKSKYPAPCPDLVELIPDEKNSVEISDDVDTQSKPPVGQLVPSRPTDDLPWNIFNPFDYFSHERRPERPAAITHNRGQFNEVPDPVIFANRDKIFDDFWNSAEEYSPIFSDDGISESPVAVVSPEPSLPPVSTSTTPQPEHKFRGSTDRPKSVYKHNYRKVPIEKNERLQEEERK